MEHKKSPNSCPFGEPMQLPRVLLFCPPEMLGEVPEAVELQGINWSTGTEPVQVRAARPHESNYALAQLR